jgi:hypothetical protein
VGDGLTLTFGWNRHAYPTSWTAGLYRFPEHPLSVPNASLIGGGTGTSIVHAYSNTDPGTHVAEPYARWLRVYQQQIFTRGPILAVIIMIGLTGLARRRAGTALPWTVAACLLITPLLTTDFDYRYLLPATPPACIAAALACQRRGAGHADGRVGIPARNRPAPIRAS